MVEGSLNGYCRYVRAAPTAMAIRPRISLPLLPTSARDHAQGQGQLRMLGLNGTRHRDRQNGDSASRCHLKLAQRGGTRVMPQAGIWALLCRLEGPYGPCRMTDWSCPGLRGHRQCSSRRPARAPRSAGWSSRPGAHAAGLEARGEERCGGVSDSEARISSGGAVERPFERAA